MFLRSAEQNTLCESLKRPLTASERALDVETGPRVTVKCHLKVILMIRLYEGSSYVWI